MISKIDCNQNRSKMKILVIMLYWYPYEGPLMPIYGAIFKDLMEKGHEITIVCSFPHFRKGRSETWDEYRGKLIHKSYWEGARLVRSYVFAPVFKDSKASLVFRALNFLSFNLSCIFAATAYGGKADIIFAPSSPPLTNGICAWIVSIFKKCPVVYNVQDLYPDMAEKLGIANNKIILAVLKKMERIVYKISTSLLVISDSMRSNLLKKKVPANKIAKIPNFIDTEFIKPMPQENPFAKQWGLAGKFVVMYAGNIGLPHGAEVIIKAAEELKDEPDITFCFVSRGEYRDQLMNQAEKNGLDAVRFIPPQPENKVPEIWASASVSLVTYRSGMADFSVPSKLLAIMCSGRPVIAVAEKGSEVSKIVAAADCGICVEPDRPKELAEAILYIRQNRTEAMNMGANGRHYALMHFDRKKISDSYEKLFFSLLQDYQK